MIRITCPRCKSTLGAKDKLAGQTRKCPKCGTPVLVLKPTTPAEPSPEKTAEVVGRTSLRAVAAPARLEMANRYLICDRAKLVANWKSDGQGWMLKTNAGMISADRNQDQIPGQGNFTLIELKLAGPVDPDTAAGLRLHGIMSYQLSRWALTNVGRDENSVLSAVTGPGCLNKEQKNVVRQAIRNQFMYEVWKDAKEVLDYLANTDYHSPGTG